MKVVEIKYTDDSFWKVFMENLIKNYTKEGVTLTPPNEQFRSIFIDAFNKTCERFDVEPCYDINDIIKNLKEKVLNDCFCRFIPNLGLILLECLLNVEQVNVADNWTKFDEGEIVENSANTCMTFSTIKIVYENSEIISDKIPKDALAVILKGRTNKSVKIELSKILKDKLDNATLKRLHKYYTSYLNLPNSEQRKIARVYKDKANDCFYRRLKSFYNRYKDKLRKKHKKIIENVLYELKYEGKSFPSFPSIVRDVNRFFTLRDNFYQRFTIPIYGQGYEKDKNILYYLLKLKTLEFSNDEMSKEFKTVLEKLDEFLKKLGIDWLSFEEYAQLFKRIEDIKNSVREVIIDHLTKSDEEVNCIARSKNCSKTTLKIKVQPTPRSVEELFVFVVERGKTDYSGLLQDFVVTLCANSNYIPRRIQIFKQKIDYNLRKEENDFINAIKSTIDSAFLYLLVKNVEFRKKVNDSIYSNFGDNKNYWFLVVLNTNTNKRRTAIHDYYYNLLDGLTNFELLLDQEVLRKIHKFKSVKELDRFIVKAIPCLKKNVGRRSNAVRAMFNVQCMNKFYKPKGEIKTLEDYKELDSNVFKKYFDPIDLDLYRFKKGGVVKVCGLPTRDKSKMLYISSKIVATELRGYLNISKFKGQISKHEWIYLSSSLKNTSTATYIFECYKNIELPNRVLTLSIEPYGFYKESNQTWTLRNIKLCEYYKDKGRENVLFDEFFLDDPLGNFNVEDCLKEVAKSVIRNVLDNDMFVIVRVAHAPKTGESHNEFVELEDEFSFEEILKDSSIKTKSSRVLGFLDRIAYTPKDLRGDSSAKIKVYYFVEDVDEKSKRICLLVYGKAQDECKVYLEPTALFCYTDKNTEDILEFLKRIAVCCLSLGDEKHELSLMGLKRLFTLPYPDAIKKLMRPAFFIKGANRIVIVKDEVI